MGCRKASYTIKSIQISYKNLVLACNKPGYNTFQLDTVDTSDSFLDTCMFTCDFVFLGWSALLVIRLVLGGRYSNLARGCIKPSASVVAQDNKTLPSLLIT